MRTKTVCEVENETLWLILGAVSSCSGNGGERNDRSYIMTQWL